MADFDVNTITAAGATLIASATAGNKLVIDGCDATTDVLTKAQAVQVSTRPATPGSNTTEVALAGSTDNHVYAYAEFIRGQSTGGDFNTFYLYGHIQNTPSVVRVIAIASASSPTHLPVSGDVTNRTELQFELTFSATDEVVTVADSSMYTTRGEFLLLKERTVTTHAEGTPTAGDAQTIRGVKTFDDKIIANDGVQSPELQFVTDDVPGAVAKIEGITSDDTTSTTARTTASAGYAAGALSKASCSVNASGANYQGYAEFTVSMAGQTSCGILFEYNSANYSAQNPHNACLASIACGNRFCTYNGELFRIRGALQVTDGTSSATLSVSGTSVSISAPVFVVGSGQNSYIFTNKLCLTSDPDEASGSIYWDNDNYVLRITRSILPDDNEAYDLGDSDYRLNDIYLKKLRFSNADMYYEADDDVVRVNASFSSNDDGYYDLGIAGYPWRNVYALNVYANNFFGCIPYPDNNTSAPPVGTIFLAILYLGQNSSHQAVSAGDTIDFTVATPVFNKIRLARFQFRSNTDIWFNYDSSTDINTGKYKVLTGGDNDLGSSNYHDSLICLVMRIQ